MSLDILRKIGLSNGEIKIYLAILDIGETNINSIHERTGIERRNVYDILNKLIKRGLISYINKNKKKLFKISSPNKIIDYISEKEDELNTIKKEVKLELPNLIEKFKLKKPLLNATIYEGKEGIKTVWEDMLNYKETYWIGSGRYVPKLMPVWFSNWNNRRIKLKVKWYNLCRYEQKSEIKKFFSYEKIKFLPKEFSVNPVVICIYGNKVANFVFTDYPFIFVIESKELAENYKRYHSYLWDKVAKS